MLCEEEGMIMLSFMYQIYVRNNLLDLVILLFSSDVHR